MTTPINQYQLSWSSVRDTPLIISLKINSSIESCVVYLVATQNTLIQWSLLYNGHAFLML